MWNDEFLSFCTDREPTVGAVIETQLHHPLSLDPPTYHVFSHIIMRLIGEGAFALRLPAMIGFLLFLLCVYVFVRRMAGPRAAIIAALLPLLTQSLRYAVEGRPYGLMLGMYGIAFVAWQSGGDEKARRSQRILALGAVTMSIWISMTSHYFGLLIFVPLLTGELVRSWQRQRLDRGMLGAMFLGGCIVATFLPFQVSLKPYRAHYYVRTVGFRDVLLGYSELFVRYYEWPFALRRLTAATLLIGVIVFITAGYRRFRRRPANEHLAEWAAIVSTAFLPFFGFLIAVTVTHVMELRFILASLIAFVVMGGLVLASTVRTTVAFRCLVALAAMLAALNFSYNIWLAVGQRRELTAALQPTPTCDKVLEAQPGVPIYTETPSEVYFNHYYATDPAIKDRLSLLFDESLELKWRQHNVNAVTARNLVPLQALPVTAWSEILMRPAPLVLVYPIGWEWVPSELAASHIPFEDLGPCLRGELIQVHAGPRGTDSQ